VFRRRTCTANLQLPSLWLIGCCAGRAAQADARRKHLLRFHANRLWRLFPEDRGTEHNAVSLSLKLGMVVNTPAEVIAIRINYEPS
jgi:hypothetical protein